MAVSDIFDDTTTSKSNPTDTQTKTNGATNKQTNKQAAEAAEDVPCFCEPQWCNGDPKVVLFTWQAPPAKKPREES